VAVIKRGKKWQYDFWVNGKRYRGSIPEARVKAQAERAVTKIRDSIYEGKYFKAVKAPALTKFVEEVFLPWCKANNRTWREFGYRSATIMKHFGNARMNEISPFQIEKFKMDRRRGVTRRGTQRSPAAVNRELGTLSRIFSLAIEHDLISMNPCRNVRFFREDNERTRYLTEDEETKLFSVLYDQRQHLAGIVGLALQTGMRRRELLQLRWSHIDFEREVIHVVNNRAEGTRTKSGRNRQVPMTSTARALLDQLSAEATSEFVFCNPDTRLPRTDIKRAFTTACRKAGIVDFHFHDLRHTAATRLGDAGVDAIKLAAIMGWSDVRMAMRYTHPRTLGLREAMENLAVRKESPRFSPQTTSGDRYRSPQVID
jgi:integrase